MPGPKLVTLVVGTFASIACSGDVRVEDPGWTEASATEVGTTSNETTNEVRLDLGGTSSDPSGCSLSDQQCGCTAVDILFVFDLSASDCEAKDRVASHFEAFIDEIDSALPTGTSIHLGLTGSAFDDSDAYHGDAIGTCASSDPLSWLEEHYLPPTEGTIPGAGRQGRLIEFEGTTYAEANTGDPEGKRSLVEWFVGAGNALSCPDSDFEYVSAGAAYAFHPDHLAGPNAGFLRREGAVLLVFLIGGTDHSFEVDDAQALKDLVVQSKSPCGEECIVASGLLDASCDPFAYAAIPFVESFSHHIWGSQNSEASYEDILGAALAEVVSTTCALVPPVG